MCKSTNFFGVHTDASLVYHNKIEKESGFFIFYIAILTFLWYYIE